MIYVQNQFGSRAPTDGEREIIKAGVMPMLMTQLQVFKKQKNRFFIIAAIVAALFMISWKSIGNVSSIVAILFTLPFALYAAHILSDFDKSISLASTKHTLIEAGKFLIKEENVELANIQYDTEGNMIVPKSIFVMIDDKEHFVSTFVEGIDEDLFGDEI